MSLVHYLAKTVRAQKGREVAEASPVYLVIWLKLYPVGGVGRLQAGAQVDLETQGPHLEPDAEACRRVGLSILSSSDKAQREGGWNPVLGPDQGT